MIVVDTHQILGITNKTKKNQKKIVKNIMLLGEGIMCRVKPKGAGFTGMKAMQGREPSVGLNLTNLPLRAGITLHKK
jgi:hypothetical protein